jgi:hypothetical protein
VPEIIGNHWSWHMHAGVMAIAASARAILIGACIWGADAVDRQTVRDLLDRTIPLTLADL